MSAFRILIVDDSAIYRKLLTQAVTAEAGECSLETAPNGSIALSKMANYRADLVLLDVFMPEMNGPEVLAILRKDYPETSVVMVSGATSQDANITINALASGALEFIPKPRGDSFADGMSQLRAQLRNILQLVRNRTKWRPSSPATPTARAVTPLAPTSSQRILPTTPPPAMRAHSSVVPTTPSVPPATRPTPTTRPPLYPEILLIGVSTGGPRALQEVIPALPAKFPVPVVLVQHMPPVFTKSLAEQLDRLSKLTVVECKDGETLVAGSVYIAPGGFHLEILRLASGAFQSKLTSAPPVNSCRPAVDVLFRSAAASRIRGAVSVILTGMGEDGTAGVAALKASFPTWSLGQDAATCVVYGMPMMLAQRGLADEVLPIQAIAPRLCSLFSVR